MLANTFGTLFRVTTFGESHGDAVGGVIDGCPAGLQFSLSAIHAFLQRRKPNPQLHGEVSTPRIENDDIHFHSGIQHRDEDTVITLGSPIAFTVQNRNVRAQDYTTAIFRPGHADYTYFKKFGIQGITGGGRASGRETVARVVAGTIAGCLLEQYDIHVYGGTEAIHNIHGTHFNYAQAHTQPLYALDSDVVPRWQERIAEVKAQGDTVGGIARVIAYGVPAGLGEPVFDKIDARLAYAIMSVGTVKGIEIGAGFTASSYTGSQNNDPIGEEYEQNNAGGILGGITTGQDILIRIAIKPIPSISKEQKTLNSQGEPCTLSIQGRHDTCVLPRVIPVLESMVKLVLTDFLLIDRARKDIFSF